MARTTAISILQAVGTNASLAEIYGFVIEAVQKETLSTAFKSQQYTGDPASGSAEFRRFVNAVVEAYGTARAAGAGKKIQAPATTVNLDVHREIVEECAKFDIDRLGVPAILRRRIVNHILSMASELDSAFFSTLNSGATAITPTATTPLGKLEEAFVTLEEVENDFVDGVPRNLMRCVCSPTFFSSVRDDLDAKPNPNVNTAAEDFGIYHGVEVHSSIHVPSGTNAQVFVNEAVAQPVVSNPYGEPEKIPLSEDYAVSLFFHYGTKLLTPDLAFKF